MSVTRDEVLELVRNLPDKVDIEELIYRLYLREKLAAAEEDIAAGQTLSLEELRNQVASWHQ
jgi:hypothetical protein